jgi:Uma2 family endonuclease
VLLARRLGMGSILQEQRRPERPGGQGRAQGRDVARHEGGCRAATAMTREPSTFSLEPRYLRSMGMPMSNRTMTEADLMNLEDDSCRHELVAGVIVAEPFPTPRHDRAVRRLRRILEEFVEAHGLGEVFGDTGYVLARDPDTVRGPDLSFVSRERLSNLDDARWFSGAPDLAVEILSPSNRRGELHAKVADYLAAGTRLVWVVDPSKRAVTTYRTLLSPQRLEPPAALDGEDVLPGLRIPLESIFER